MKSATKLIFLALSLSFLAVGCANENSTEQVNREKLDRERARNSSAQGNYSGYLVKRGTGDRIPFMMNVSVIENTTNSTSSLQASLTVGMFGGVNVTSNTVRFDRGSGELDVYFSQAGPGANVGENSTIQINATIQNKLITRGTFRGANSGMFDFDVNTSDTQFEGGTDVELLTTFKASGNGPETKAIVTLTRRLDPQPSKAGMDLPQLPSLASTIRFESLGDAAMQFSQTLYDPLKGEIELDFQNNNRVIFRGVYLPKNIQTDKIGTLTGTLYQGGAVRASASAHVLTEKEGLANTPPQTYAGTVTNAEGVSAKVVATVVIPGQVVNNPGNAIFPLFPNMQFEVGICGAGAKLPFLLARVDQIEEVVNFNSSIAGRVYNFEAKTTSSWSSLTGVITTSQQGSTQRMKLSLKAAKNASCN